MPCYKCPNGKWKMGKDGSCRFHSKASCERAWDAYRAREHSNKKKEK